MNRIRIAAGGAVLSACAIAGIIGGIAESSATTASGNAAVQTTTTTNGTHPGGVDGRHFGRYGHGGFGGGRAIHSVSVQLNAARTGYVTVTTDGGTLKSVDTTSDTVTIVEGVSTSPYATPTIPVPSAATVTLDGKSSTLGSLATGDRIIVRSSSDGTTTVFATDASFTPGNGTGPWGGNWHHGGAPPSGTTTTTTLRAPRRPRPHGASEDAVGPECTAPARQLWRAAHASARSACRRRHRRHPAAIAAPEVGGGSSRRCTGGPADSAGRLLKGGGSPERLRDCFAGREAVGVDKPLDDQAVEDGHHQCRGNVWVYAPRSWLCCLELLDPGRDGRAQQVEVPRHHAAQTSDVLGAQEGLEIGDDEPSVGAEGLEQAVDGRSELFAA